MHSSTSSSERTVVSLPWPHIFGTAAVIFLLFVAGMEARLAQVGIRATVKDSQEKWEAERIRASQLGGKALILIGASRIQLGVDLNVLRKKTGLEPVQLAIDGSTAMPILEGLASDPTIRGTVLVDYYDNAIGQYGGLAEKYQGNYAKHGADKTGLSPYSQSEKFLTEWVQERSLSYADGANPLNSFLSRILNDDGARSLVITQTDRSRLGDYRHAKMPDYYYRRVARNLEIELSTIDENTAIALGKRIASEKARDNSKFLRDAIAVRQMVSRIEARGGRVFFVAMPSSGMVKEIEEKRYPSAKFWEQFVTIVGTPAVRSADHPLLKDFLCPDGSHLDFRDREKFTEALVHAFGIERAM